MIGVHYTANADAANATLRDIEALGVKAVGVKADLREGKDAADSLWAQFSEAAHTETGSAALDILVNNAGIAPALPLKQTSEAAFDEVMTTNWPEYEAGPPSARQPNPLADAGGAVVLAGTETDNTR